MIPFSTVPDWPLSYTLTNKENFTEFCSCNCRHEWVTCNTPLQPCVQDALLTCLMWYFNVKSILKPSLQVVYELVCALLWAQTGIWCTPGEGSLGLVTIMAPALCWVTWKDECGGVGLQPELIYGLPLAEVLWVKLFGRDPYGKLYPWVESMTGCLKSLCFPASLA